MNIASRADESLARFGTYEALAVGDRSYTSTELHDASARFAAALVAAPISAGERVVVLLPNGADLVVVHAGILRAGAVVVLLHPSSTAAEVAQVIEHSGATVFVTSPQLRANMAEAARVPWRLVTGPEGGDGWHALDRLVAAHRPLEHAVARAAADLAQLVYTSGTTSAPKGVPYTHGTSAARLRMLAARFEYQRTQHGDAWPGDVVLTVLPFAHSFGTDLLTRRLVVREKLVLLPEFHARAAADAIERHRVTVTSLVPSMCEALLALPDLERHDLSSLQAVAVGGAPVSSALVDRFEARMKVRPSVAYGLTELAGATLHVPGCKPGSVGRLMPGVRARIVGEDGAELPLGEVGEVQLSSAWMMHGYYGEAGSEAVRDGWLRTGDLGRLDADRELFIVGRSKDVISQGGVKVYAQDVRDTILALPGVQDCAAIGLPSVYLGEEVVACVVRAPDGPSADEVLAHCRRRADPRKAPVEVRFFAELPRTVLGKIQTYRLVEAVRAARAAVQETELVRRLRALPATQRSTTLRTALEAEVARVLRRPGALDSRKAFGELGLDSLGAVEVAHAVSALLGRPFSATLTFDHPTIDAVVQHALAELFGADERASPPRVRSRGLEREPIAVVGAACRLPGGADSPEAFWALLRDGVDATRDAASDRWDLDAIYDPRPGTPGKTYVRRAALLDAPGDFDAELFDLSAREAANLDPQHRLLLEVSWEALERAGRAPRDGSAQRNDERTGAFFGITGSSYPSSDALGVLPCMAVGRLSHLLDLRGPAVAVDTACSSALVALHGAIASLQRHESDVALTGGVNVICSASAFIGLATVQALAPDGRCKTFDASADGFGQGEGCVVFVLRRLSDAQRDGDPILGVLRGSATNHDGHSSSLAAPSGRAQQAVLRDALADADVAPASIDYLEAHGTGTALGDPIELQSAIAVLGEGRARPLVVGSAKTNVGHLSAAAGAVGLLKVLLALEHEALPPHLHFQRLNPILAPLADRLDVPTTLRPWPRTAEAPRRAGVTSMGLSGTNAHVVVEEPPAVRSRPAVAGPQLLCLSARSDVALRELARRYAQHLEGDRVLADLCYTASTGRTPLPYRAAIVAASPADARARLHELAGADEPFRAALSRPRVAFLFTGQGSQYVGMGRALYAAEPVFRRALHRCAEVLQPLLPRPPLDALFAETPPSPALAIDDTALAQPLLFALEWSLAELWRSWGIEPDLVMGHSLGEYVAACVAGLFTVEDGLRLAATRGRLMQALPAGGAMTALAIDEAQVRAAIAPFADRLAVSANNGPSTTVISGERAAVDAVAAGFLARGVKVTPLRVSHAFHSPLMDPMLDELEAVVAQVRFGELRTGFVSTCTGAAATTEALTAPGYWRRQLREPVRFAAAVSTLVGLGCDTFLEVGPQPVLLAMARGCVQDEQLAWIPSLRKDRDDEEQLLSSLGRLFARGLEPAWAGVYRDRDVRKVIAPAYPFQRKRHWTLSGFTSAPARASSTAAAPRPAPAVTFRAQLAAEPPERRASLVREHLARLVARVLDRTSVAPDESLLDAGLDSLRVVDLLGAIRRRLDVECSPAELVARPTLSALAEHLRDKLLPPTAVESSPLLVALEPRGSRSPVFCFHPAGGQITSYLRLKAQLGDDRPLYAIESRACSAPAAEFPTVLAMASAYATLVQAARPVGPRTLLGWSMGGVVAHAVACELEHRGVAIEALVLVDAPLPTEQRGEAQELALALSGALHELLPAPPSPELLARALREVDTAEPAVLHALCDRLGLLAGAEVSVDALARALRLRRAHFAMIAAHHPAVCAAPIRAWWADMPVARRGWGAFTRGGLVEHELGGDHFSIMREPRLDAIVAALRDGQR